MPRGRNEAVAEDQALEDQQQPQLEAPVDDRPDWLLDRYQDVEAQARGYAEAERRMTEATQRASAAEQTVAQMAERLQQLEEAQQQQQQQSFQQPYDASTDPYLLAAQQAYEEGDYMRAQQINDMRTAQIVQAALQQWSPPQQQGPEQNMDMLGALLARDMKDRYGDEWDTIRQEVTQHAAQYLDPAMPYERMRETLTFIGDKVSGDRKLAEQTARLQNQQQSEQQKRLAQTAPGGSGMWNAPSDNRREELRQQWRDMGLIPGQ